MDVTATGYWVVGVFIATQIGSLIWILASNKADARILKMQMLALDAEVKKLSNVLIDLANLNGRLTLFEERQVAQGKRVDEAVSRMNRHIDHQVGCPIGKIPPSIS